MFTCSVKPVAIKLVIKHIHIGPHQIDSGHHPVDPILTIRPRVGGLLRE